MMTRTLLDYTVVAYATHYTDRKWDFHYVSHFFLPQWARWSVLRVGVQLRRYEDRHDRRVELPGSSTAVCRHRTSAILSRQGATERSEARSPDLPPEHAKGLTVAPASPGEPGLNTRRYNGSESRYDSPYIDLRSAQQADSHQPHRHLR
jgi:hypothetical protein